MISNIVAVLIGFVVLLVMIDFLMRVFKINNIRGEYDLGNIAVLVTLLYRRKGILVYSVIAIIVLITLLSFFAKKYNYSIINIKEDKIQDIEHIIKNHMHNQNDIELIPKAESITLKGSKPSRSELKPVLREINHYVKVNGKVTFNTVSYSFLMVVIAISSFILGMVG